MSELPIQSAPPGGPACVNGVLYQLLWSLVTLGGFRGRDPRLADGELKQITLVLEPSSGGDQQEVAAGKKVVAQLKARSTGQPWSLKQVVADVFPDLYGAISGPEEDVEYQLVTEGGRGRWGDVENFFKTLPPPLSGNDDLLAALDDEKEIKFGRVTPSDRTSGSSFWGPQPYTARKLFCKIVETIRLRSPAREEACAQTCRKAWQLLRGFRFVGGVTHESLRDAVDEWLLARISGSASRLPEKRDNLLLDLARQACSGDAVVDAVAFFKAHGLDGVPLTLWSALTHKASSYLEGVFRRKQIDLADDVRPSIAQELAESWTNHSPILILTGGSGDGKTFQGYGLLSAARAAGDVAILVESHGDATQDLSEAARVFWHDIADRDEAIPLGRLRARLKSDDPENSARRLAVLIDNVANLDEARRLVEADWEGWGVRVALTCPAGIAEAVRSTLGSRGRIVEVAGFQLGDVEVYLSQVVGIEPATVRFDVRKTLRRPLLAKLFGEVVRAEGWQPRNEYDLFERSWSSLRHRGAQPFDLDALRRLAKNVLLEGARYPWTASDLAQVGLDNAALVRLTAAGWLRETANEGFEVWHDRLLNWAVAEAIVHDLRRDVDCATMYIPTVAKLLSQPVAACGRLLGYVPMDVLWLLSDAQRPLPDLFERFVAAYEDAFGWRAPEELYKELLPTLSERAMPMLTKRLRAAAGSNSPFAIKNLLDGICAAGTDLAAIGIGFLEDTAPKVRRIGVGIFERRPTDVTLDRLWDIHREALRNPGQFLYEHESNWSLYDQTFGALKACVPLDPLWLERAIQTADPTREPMHDLAYLLANTGDASLWGRCKSVLMSAVDEARQRSVATCIWRFRDAAESGWLEARVGIREDFLGVIALRGLVAVDPDRAVELLDKVDDGQLYGARDWCFAELYLRRPEQVMAHIAQRLRSHPEPSRFALILQGREDLIDLESFDLLLNRLDAIANETAKAADPANVSPEFRTSLFFVNAVSHPRLLDRVRNRRNSSLEAGLTAWLLAVGPQSGMSVEHDKHECLNALTKIGGDGFNAVLDDWLRRGDWYARIHAVKLAQRRVTPTTVELLASLARESGPDDPEGRLSVLRGYATAALAAHECWRPVFDYYLKVGFSSLQVVAECCPEPAIPIEEDALRGIRGEFEQDGLPNPGAVSAVAVARVDDLLPAIRDVLRRAEPESNLTAACLVSLTRLRDKDPATVPYLVRALEHHRHLAINALLTNGDASASEALARYLNRAPNLELALILANEPEHRATAFEVIRKAAVEVYEFRWSQGGTQVVVARLKPDALRELADLQEVFAIAEEIGYSDYEPSRVSHEKPAALRIVAQRQPEAAFRMALARLCNPETPDGELYASVVVEAIPAKAEQALLDSFLTGLPSRAVFSIGRELYQLGASSTLSEWITDPSEERRLAACRLARFLEWSDNLSEKIRELADDPDNRVALAASDAFDELRNARTANELVQALATEHDPVHRWALLDALIDVGDPGDGHVGVPWLAKVSDGLTPAMTWYLKERIKKRREKLREELNKQDK